MKKENDSERRGNPATSQGSLELTSTGADAAGKLFRESATILRLEGKNCTYRARHSAAVGSWLMMEIKGGLHETSVWRAGARVKAISPDEKDRDVFLVDVELDHAHGATIRPASGKPKEARNAQGSTEGLTAPSAAPSAAQVETLTPLPQVQGKETSEEQTFDIDVRQTEIPAPAAKNDRHTNPARCDGAGSDPGVAATASEESSLAGLARMIHSGLVAEYERRLSELKTTIAVEVEKAAQEILTARMGQALEAAIETKMAQYTESLPAITDQVVEKIAGRLAKIPQLEASLDTLSQGLTEKWSAISQKVTEAARANVATKIAEIEELARRMTGDLERRLDDHRAKMQSLLELSEKAFNESATASARAQETMKRLNEVTEAAAPLMDVSLRERFETRSAEFANQIDHIVIERAARFMSDVELLLASRLGTAEEALRELARQMETSQEMLRKQEEYLRGLVSATAKEVDQQIREVLRRLAGTS